MERLKTSGIDGVTDAAVIRIQCPDPEIYDVTLLPEEMILTRQAINDYEISEGSEMFDTVKLFL